MEKRRYLELDALRGIAAISVVFFHYTSGKGLSKIFSLGVSAVDLFFLISGFVIFMSINKISSGKKFVINRISRLYPTYWFCVTFTFAVMMFLKITKFPINQIKIYGSWDYLANLTMFQLYFNVPNLDGPYWTLIVEMLFYIVILILFELNLLKHITLISCLINILIIFNFFLVTNNYISNYTDYFPLVNHFPLFFAGIIFYKMAINEINKKGYFILLFCMLTQILIFRFLESDPFYISQIQYSCMLIIYFSLFILFITNHLKFIVNRLTIFLGEISYALYLIHSYAFRGIIGFLQNHYHIPFWIVTLFIVLPIVISFAYLITKFIERPYSKKLKYFLQNKFNAVPKLA
ncbi:MAG TPA: acyltransferase [Hanamia sp.]